MVPVAALVEQLGVTEFNGNGLALLPFVSVRPARKLQILGGVCLSVTPVLTVGLSLHCSSCSELWGLGTSNTIEQWDSSGLYGYPDQTR